MTNAKMFNLIRKDNEWAFIYTGEHSKEDISYMGELLETVSRVREALIKDELFSVLEPNMADTLDLLSSLGEIEKCTGWNMFEIRDTEELVSSLTRMLLSHNICNTDGVESRNWVRE